MTAPSRTDPIDFMEAPSVRRGAASRRAYISRELSGKARRRHAAARQRPLSAVIVNNPGIGGDDLNVRRNVGWAERSEAHAELAVSQNAWARRFAA
jgi:hypothetical protein